MSLNKTKEFYNLLRAQFIKEISEDHEISKILSSDTIEKLDRIWHQKLENSGVYQPLPNEQIRQPYNSNILPGAYPPFGYNPRGGHIIPPPNMNARLQEHRPQPLRTPNLKQDFQEKVEDHFEVKQEDKNETEHIANTNEPTKKSEDAGKVHKPSKKEDEEYKKDEFDEKEEKEDDADEVNSQKSDLFDENTEKVEKDQAPHEDTTKRPAPQPAEEFSPLGSDDSIGDPDTVDATDMIVGYHEKVHRHGTKWKVNLKNCIMSLRGKEYILSTVTGEFDF